MQEHEGGFRKNIETGARTIASGILFVAALVSIGAGSLAVAAAEGLGSYLVWPKAPAK